MAKSLQPFVDEHLIAGAVTLVANRERTLDTETVGYADIANQVPMSPDTLFWIASMTKPITITALMILVEEGKVDLDAPVEKYLPDFKGQMVAVEKDDSHVLLRLPSHPMLVREIMSHTSGLMKHISIDFMKWDTLPLADYVRVAAQSALESQPGTRYDYTNAGIDTAGRIIEVVGGMPYERFVATHFFEPLGMKDTTFFPTKEQLRRLAKCYRATKDGLLETRIPSLTYPLDGGNRHAVPAAGLFSTAKDLARFCQMMLSGGVYEGRRYLRPETISLISRKQTAASIAEPYGLGWRTAWGKDKEAYGHDGALRTDMFIEPKVGFVAIFMTHHDGGWANEEENKVWPAFIQTAYDIAATRER